MLPYRGETDKPRRRHEGRCNSHSNGFLAAADINAPDNFSLSIELPLDAILQLPDHFHEIEDFKLRLFGRERRALTRAECVRIHRFRVHLYLQGGEP